MLISFFPQRRDDALEVHKQGDVLTINGEAFDFTDLPDGGMIAFGDCPCDWLMAPIERVGGELRVTLALPFRIGNRHVAAPPPLENPPDGQLVLPNLDQVEPLQGEEL